MLLCIGELLQAPEICELQALFDGGNLRAGKATAGWHAKQVKDNRQIRPGSQAAKRGNEMLAKAFARNAVFQSALLPRRIRPALFARYLEGMAYGGHVDDAIMTGPDGTGDPMRTDISVTVFLNDPGEYEGGELMIEGASEEQAFKLPAGSAVAYPSTALHRVAPVTSGQRDVAVTWVESLVVDPRAREILFDVDRTRRAIYESCGKSPEFDTLSKTHANLIRMWART